jgi:hypothetical protein
MNAGFFTVEYRDRVQQRVLEMARRDSRIVAGAIVGSLANGGGDRWSDLDLTFGLAKDVMPAEILADWSREIQQEFGAAHLFDLPFRSSLYRVFLFPGNLQVDLSFTPGAEFGAITPKFELLFGAAVKRDPVAPPSARDLFGLAVHHVVRARICIERGRLMEAEHLIHDTRDQVLALACLQQGIEHRYGRGFDRLPEDLRSRAEAAMVCAIAAPELLRALGETIDMLLEMGKRSSERLPDVEADLRSLDAPIA